MTKVTLVYTKTCSYCPAAKQLWKDLQKQHKFDYEEVDAVSPKGQVLVTKFGIMAVPTTIIEKNGKSEVAFTGVPNKEKAVEKVSR